MSLPEPNMASNTKPYRRLPGTGYRQVIPGWSILLLFFVIGIFALLFRGRRIQLWQGEEHLLLVEWDGNREFYKRFHYRDIQAFMVRKTFDGMALNGVLGALCLLFAGLAIPVPEVGFRIFLLVLAGIFGLLLLSNFISGPTCQCSIRTAVQVEELPSLCRLRRVRKVLERLRPLIAAAQGQLAPEEVSARMQEKIAAAHTGVGAAPAATPQYVVDDPNAPPRMVS
jgi:hypothetical protein